MRQSTKEINVCLHTIGKISEESRSYMAMQRINALTGDLDSLSIITKMVVQMSTNARVVMDGKSKSIIQIITS